MMAWWNERGSRLWWKEFRESWPPAALALAVVLAILFLNDPDFGADAARRYFWGANVLTYAGPIFLFISLVLGITAYAVEQEQETLEPLLARPIRAQDVLATKLGVRLGVVAAMSASLGIVMGLIGAWPRQYAIPHPVIFEYWLAVLAVSLLGLAVGFYFGKIVGSQTRALVAGLLAVGIGFVLLSVSPLAVLFESGDYGEYVWIRSILIPFLVTLGVLVLAIRSRPGRMALVRRPVTAALALAVYALVAWILSVVPPGQAWTSFEQYAKHWQVRYAGPERVLDLLEGRFIYRVAWQPGADPLEVLADRTSVAVEYVYPDEVREPTSYLLARSPGYRPRRQRYLRTVTDFESTVRSERDPELVTECLELVQGPDVPSYRRAIAVHLAGADHEPRNTDLIARMLEDPSPHVRRIAAWALLARDDERGIRYLQRIAPHIRDEEEVREITYTSRILDVDLEGALEPLMREWIGSEDGSRHSVALAWFRRNGSIQDLELVREALWEQRSYRRWEEGYRDRRDLDVTDYLDAWGSPRLVPELLRLARRRIEQLEALRDAARTEAFRLDSAVRYVGIGRSPELFWYRSHAQSLQGILTDLARNGVTETIALWREARDLLGPDFNYRHYDYSRDALSSFLPQLPRLSEAGFEVLRQIVADTGELLTIRMQAALILSYHGFREFDEQALRYFELARGSKQYERYGNWESYVFEVFSVMVHSGNLRYVGPILDRAWEGYRGEEAGYGLLGGRSRFGWVDWTIHTAELLEEATGQELGWDLDAWTAWWEREGRSITTGENE